MSEKRDEKIVDVGRFHSLSTDQLNALQKYYVKLNLYTPSYDDIVISLKSRDWKNGTAGQAGMFKNITTQELKAMSGTSLSAGGLVMERVSRELLNPLGIFMALNKMTSKYEELGLKGTSEYTKLSAETAQAKKDSMKYLGASKAINDQGLIILIETLFDQFYKSTAGRLNTNEPAPRSSFTTSNFPEAQNSQKNKSK